MFNLDQLTLIDSCFLSKQKLSKLISQGPQILIKNKTKQRKKKSQLVEHVKSYIFTYENKAKEKKKTRKF